MEMVKLLDKLKGKQLDETHYELMCQAVKLQQEKLKLLRNVNKTLQENNVLLREKIRLLKHELARMRSEPETRLVLDSAVPSSDTPRHIQEISDLTVAILRECLKRNPAAFNPAEMTDSLSCDRGEVEKSLAELVESGLVHLQSNRRGEAAYLLTAAGRSYAQTLPA